MLTEIGKPMLGIESGKNFPARMVGCSSSTTGRSRTLDTPAATLIISGLLLFS